MQPRTWDEWRAAASWEEAQLPMCECCEASIFPNDERETVTWHTGVDPDGEDFATGVLCAPCDEGCSWSPVTRTFSRCQRESMGHGLVTLDPRQTLGKA